MKHEIKYSSLVWSKFQWTVWDCQRQMPVRQLQFPKWSAIAHWYFWNCSLLYIRVLSIHHFLPLSTVIHMLMVSRDPQQDRAQMGYGEWCTCYVCLEGRAKLGARKLCGPFLHIGNWSRSKQTDLLKMPQAIYGGAGNWIQISWILSRALTSKASFLTNHVYQTSQTSVCISAYPHIWIPLWSWKLVCSLLPHPQRFDKVVKPA